MKAKLAILATTLSLLIASPSSAAETGQVTVKGSDTMVHLVSDWAENFMDQHENVEISVTGGGSGTGIASLINKTTDLAAASREMKEEEKEAAKKNSVTPQESKVALDGLAIIVHPSNPVKELTVEQLGKIYTGAIKNWKEVGGPDLSIGALSRESSSGTYVFFQEHVLNKKDFAPEVKLMPATASMVETVKNEKGAVAYVGLGYANEAKSAVKALPIKADDKAEGVLPSSETVLNGKYPVSRPLYLYTNGAPAGNVKAFIDYVQSAEGQKVVEEAGYVSIKQG